MTGILTRKQRIEAFVQLANALHNPDEQLKHLIDRSMQFNAWFNPENTAKAVSSIAKMLNEKDLNAWLDERYENANHQFKVGLILAGNIPMVGFHDILCVLASGNKALIKLSSQDKQLIPYVLNKLVEIEPAFKDSFEYVDKLKDFDAVIATGSNNSARYFDYYFGNVPNIIRKNRNSVAVLNGNESREELHALGHDIFDYFGLGCRNVSKIYVPKGYKFDTLFKAIEDFKTIADHHKYNNNYDYNKSIFLVNMEKHFDNGFLLIKEDERFSSPLAVLYYEEYENLTEVDQKLTEQKDQIQCIISNEKLSMNCLGFGESQCPRLWDYADGVDTMGFLKELVRD